MMRDLSAALVSSGVDRTFSHCALVHSGQESVPHGFSLSFFLSRAHAKDRSRLSTPWYQVHISPLNSTPPMNGRIEGVPMLMRKSFYSLLR